MTESVCMIAIVRLWSIPDQSRTPTYYTTHRTSKNAESEVLTSHFTHTYRYSSTLTKYSTESKRQDSYQSKILHLFQTRSQAVARIADCTASQQTLVPNLWCTAHETPCSQLDKFPVTLSQQYSH